jgi:hypothetical protein
MYYTRKNAQVVTGLQTSCYKSVHKLSTSCVRTACCNKFRTGCHNNLLQANDIISNIFVTRLF